jgi:hypothetical protein
MFVVVAVVVVVVVDHHHCTTLFTGAIIHEIKAFEHPNII